MKQRDLFPRSLQYLVAIAKLGSYTKAAEALHVSQPTMSQKIKLLEESLQSTLLDRSGRTVQLTDAGEIYIDYARRAWEELNGGARAIHDVLNLSRGTLHLGWTPITDYITSSLFENFNSLYPGINLSTFELPQDEIEKNISESHIDLGIVFSNSLTDPSESNEIEPNILFEEKLCVAVGKAHLRAGHQKQMSIQAFEQESLALPNTNFTLRHYVDDYCQKHGIKPLVAVEANSLNAVISMIKNRPLVTVLPYSIIQEQRGLHVINLSPKLPRKAISMIYRSDGYKSPACLAFSKLALDWSQRRSNNNYTNPKHSNELAEACL